MKKGNKIFFFLTILQAIKVTGPVFCEITSIMVFYKLSISVLKLLLLESKIVIVRCLFSLTRFSLNFKLPCWKSSNTKLHKTYKGSLQIMNKYRKMMRNVNPISAFNDLDKKYSELMNLWFSDFKSYIKLSLEQYRNL